MLIIPLRKADASQRRVYARLDETVDRAGEAMNYAESAPIIKAWSDAQFAASGGLSRGNVRGQHTRVAAGKVAEITFDDDNGVIEFGIDVVDDGEWDKVIKGVYTGISPKGKAKRTKGADGVVRYNVLSLEEVSLVDLPCSPGATFTLIKADGAHEEVAFAELAAASPDPDLMKALMSAPTLREYGAVVAAFSADALEKSFGEPSLRAGEAAVPLFSPRIRRELAISGSAMPDGSFPVTDQASLEAALCVLEKSTDDAVQSHVVLRAVDLGLVDVLPEAWRPATPVAEPLEKGLNTVSRLASLLDSLTWLACDVASEATFEMDGSAMPARLCAWLSEGAAILTAMATEEAGEAIAGLQAAVAALPVPATPMVKAAGFSSDALGMVLQLTGELASTRDDLVKAHATHGAALAELERLRAMPTPGGARLRAVSRGDDIGSAADPKNADLEALNAMPDGFAKARAATHLALTGRI